MANELTVSKTLQKVIIFYANPDTKTGKFSVDKN